MKPLLAVSMGDPAGIGAEVIVRAAAKPAVRRSCRILVFGDEALLEAARKACRLARAAPSAIVDVERPEDAPLFPRGRPAPGRRAGGAAFAYLEGAAEAARSRRADALVTAPVNKMWVAKAGHDFDGHTGYLSCLAGERAVMMLAGTRLRVVLVTEHLAHADVSAALRTKDIVHAGRVSDAHLRRYEGLRRVRLAAAALNPHAGEGGLFGDEETRVIGPALRRLRRERVVVEGPLPADTLFAAAQGGQYDAVICMYHDQGLIPLKLLEFGGAVNVSMGLPFIRTSPDHGTAYDLAGSGRADAGSMEKALLAAAAMAGRARRVRR